VIFAGARGGLWTHALAGVSHRFRTPALAAIAFVAPSIPIWGDLRPGQPSPYNVLPWLTIGLIAVGVICALVLAAVQPQVLERAPALLEGDQSLATDPLLVDG
jgi:hypothetical protein